MTINHSITKFCLDGLTYLLLTFFTQSPVTAAQGHDYKSSVNHSRGVRQQFFAERVVGPWNS